jgi:RNase H-like domain found in reverse transcriptase
VWINATNDAFEATKKAIANCTLTLGFFFGENLQTTLYTGASPYALGAGLVQVDNEGSQRVISFAYKVLTQTEAIYPQIQKEALAVIWAVEGFITICLTDVLESKQTRVVSHLFSSKSEQHANES